MKWQSQNNSFSGVEKKGECENAGGKEGYVQVRRGCKQLYCMF